MLRPDGSVGIKCGWVGDSRAVASIGGTLGPEKVLELSFDHKADHPEEISRIENYYDSVRNGDANSPESVHGGSATGSVKVGISGASPGESFKSYKSNGNEGSLAAGSAVAALAAGITPLAGGGSGSVGKESLQRSEGGAEASRRGSGAHATAGTNGGISDDSVKGAVKLFSDRAGLKADLGPDGLPVIVTKRANKPGAPAAPPSSGYGVGVIESAEDAPPLSPQPQPPPPPPPPRRGQIAPELAPEAEADAGSNPQLRPGKAISESSEDANMLRGDSQAAQAVSSHGSRVGAESPRAGTSEKKGGATFIDALRNSAKNAIQRVSDQIGTSSHSKGTVVPLPTPVAFDTVIEQTERGEESGRPVRARTSFVGRLKDPRTGRVSKPRLFGGNGAASVGMTRSIGDRNCARACISRPDIRTFEVPPGESARIIIASDGVWDTIKNEEAVRTSKPSLFDKNPATSAAAMRVVKAAHHSRESLALPMDDITCFIIDLSHPSGAAEQDASCSCLKPRRT